MKALALLLPVVFSLALTLPGASREGFLHEDEWRNAVMVREMAVTGPVLHPRLHGGLYPDYPPLYFWTALPVAKLAPGEPAPAAGSRLLTLAVRLPSVLGAALLAFGTALLALRLGSARTALGAGLLVSVLPGLHFEERRAMIDPLFSGLACVSVALMARASWRSFAAGCVFLALAWLTKGPLGAVVIGLALAGGEGAGLALGATKEEWRSLEARAFAFVAFVAFVAWVWFGLAYSLEGKEYGDNLLYTQTLGRSIPGAILQHQKPWPFYLGTTLPALLPILAFGALGVRRTRLSLFALGWFGLVLVFFSALNTKRSYYPMPAYPAVALLAASFFESETRRVPEWARIAWRSAFSWALVVAAVAGLIVGFYDHDYRSYGVAVSLGSALGWIAFRALRRKGRADLAVAAASGFVLASAFASIVPALTRMHGNKDLAADAGLRGVAHFAVAPGGQHREALCFWFGPSPLQGTDNVESATDHADPAKVRAWLAQFPPGTAGVIMSRRDVEGELDPLRSPDLVRLAASDNEESSEAYIVIGRRR